MRPREWLVPALAGILGVAVGAWLADGHSPAAIPETSSVAPRLAQPTGTSALDGSMALTLDDVRRVVRQELDARASAASTALPAARAQPDPPTPNQAMAAAQARAVLDAAIARRTWTELDSDALRESFHELSSDQQAELLQAYSMAVNQGRLVPQTDRAPF